MKKYTMVAIILIALGIVALSYQGLSYTTREKVIDLGPVQMTAEKTRTLPLTPIVGGLSLIVGIMLLIMGRKKS